jgi:hypothetical protein
MLYEAAALHLEDNIMREVCWRGSFFYHINDSLSQVFLKSANMPLVSSNIEQILYRGQDQTQRNHFEKAPEMN